MYTNQQQFVIHEQELQFGHSDLCIFLDDCHIPFWCVQTMPTFHVRWHLQLQRPMFVAWHLETWSCQRQYSHWESLPDWQRKHQWNPNCQNQRHCREYHRTKRSGDRSLEYVDINSWTSPAIWIMAGGSWSNVLSSSEALVTYYILLLEVYVSLRFSWFLQTLSWVYTTS